MFEVELRRILGLALSSVTLGRCLMTSFSDIQGFRHKRLINVSKKNCIVVNIS